MRSRLAIGLPGAVFDAVSVQQRHLLLWVVEMPNGKALPADSGTAVPNRHVLSVHAAAVHQGRLFAIIERVEGVTLAQQLTMVRAGGHPVPPAAVAAIGIALCDLAELAAWRARPIDPALVLLGADHVIKCVDPGLVHLLALPPSHTSLPTAPGAPFTRHLAQLLLTAAGAGAEGARPRASKDLRALRQALSVGDDGSEVTRGELRTRLQSVARPNRRWRGVGWLAATIAGVLAVAVSVPQLLRSARPWLQTFMRDTILDREAERGRSHARALAEKWREYSRALGYESAAHTEAGRLHLAQGDENYRAGHAASAKVEYTLASERYAQAIAEGDRFVAERELADTARVRAMGLAEEWRGLLAAAAIESPEQIGRAEQLLAEGARHYADLDFARARLSYGGALQLFLSASKDSVQRLAWRHEAEVAKAQAHAAGEAWRLLVAQLDLPAEASASNAAASLAEADALVADGRHREAVAKYAEANDGFVATRDRIVRTLVARERAQQAADLARDSARQWQGLVAALGREAEPASAAALELVATGDRLLDSATWDAAEFAFAQAVESYRSLIADLQQQLRVRAEEARTRANSRMTRLQDLVLRCKERVEQARAAVVTLSQQFALQTNAAKDQVTSTLLGEARADYEILSKWQETCSRHVFPGSAGYTAAALLQEQAHSSFDSHHYADAVVAYERAAAALEGMLAAVSTCEACLRQDMKIEGILAGITANLGRVAIDLPEIAALLATCHDKVADGRRQHAEGRFVKAERAFGDALLAVESVIPEAKVRLLRFAQLADAEYRTESALVALQELLALDPASPAARELLQKLQSPQAPPFRIALLPGELRIQGKALTLRAQVHDLHAIVGEPSRRLEKDIFHLYDALGFTAIATAEGKRLSALTMYLRISGLHSEPRKAFAGAVEVNGRPLPREATPQALQQSFPELELTDAGSRMFQGRLGRLKLLLAYDPTRDWIERLVIQFPEQ